MGDARPDLRGAAIAAAIVGALDDRALEHLADRLAPWLIAPPRPWLDVVEAADYLRCTKQRIYDLVHAGRLVPRRDGRRLLFHREQLDAYLGRNTGDA